MAFAVEGRLCWQWCLGRKDGIWGMGTKGRAQEADSQGARRAPSHSRLTFPQSSQQPAPDFPLLPSREELRSLFQARAKLPPVCQAVTGLEGTSQQALRRSRVLRRTFASSFASVKRKAPCFQIKLQMVSGAPQSHGVFIFPALYPSSSLSHPIPCPGWGMVSNILSKLYRTAGVNPMLKKAGCGKSEQQRNGSWSHCWEVTGPRPRSKP